jgi:septal ring factor EnvC (AmiA/AmiB activator)
MAAEEVAQVYPGLVAYSPDGRPQAVRYQFLAPMLLNEYQNQQRTIQTQAAEIAKQTEEITKQTADIAALRREQEIQTARINDMEKQTAELEKLKQQAVLLTAAIGHLDQFEMAKH